MLKDGSLETLERLYSDRWSLVYTKNFQLFLKEKSQIAANDEWEAASEAGRV
jgi:hypothetical protein